MKPMKRKALSDEQLAREIGAAMETPQGRNVIGQTINTMVVSKPRCIGEQLTESIPTEVHPEPARDCTRGSVNNGDDTVQPAPQCVESSTHGTVQARLKKSGLAKILGYMLEHHILCRDGGCGNQQGRSMLNDQDKGKITCRACGRKVHRINRSHFRNCTCASVEDYRKRYPDAPLMSQHLRDTCYSKAHMQAMGRKRGAQYREYLQSLSPDQFKKEFLDKVTAKGVPAMAKFLRSPEGKEQRRNQVLKRMREMPEAEFRAWMTKWGNSGRAASLKKWKTATAEERMRRIQPMLQTNQQLCLPTSPERIVIGFAVPGLEYTGDGKFYIRAGKPRNPDFAHFDTKKVVEVFGDYWHSEVVKGVPREEHVQQTIADYRSVGWDCLVLWEGELGKTPDRCHQRIVEFLKPSETARQAPNRVKIQSDLRSDVECKPEMATPLPG